jgi:hypothetical protein
MLRIWTIEFKGRKPLFIIRQYQILIEKEIKMTIQDLIKKLNKYPPDTIVLGWDGDLAEYSLIDSVEYIKDIPQPNYWEIPPGKYVGLFVTE